MGKINELMLRGMAWRDNVFNRSKKAMTSVRKGEVAFEYIIILVLMVAFIVAAFLILRPVILNKAKEIADFVGGVNIETGVVPGQPS